ncbi:replication-associated recombination protein A [Tissierella creatinophila DSM 6911]|uniref:Replication-associated recombination protein A n=2 Tax=Tissierella creatinophila TaxID=79681 RepID=A0A1U7M9D4_TISCR|nr:replication-associated recombination protein A [Tissierella creatinophila DSM 6911]
MECLLELKEGDRMDLFTLSMEEKLKRNAPLADRLRPRKLDEFVGQDHLLGEDKFLNRSIKADRITSMILYGPPGIGKTTLAMIIANTTAMKFEKLSAVTSGVKDIREVIKNAEEYLKIYNKRTILFIDEIHRFNKSQQDALLPFVERGIIILIGATTENPYFEINKALLSRAMVLSLKPLSDKDLLDLLNKALKDKERGLGCYNVEIDKEAIDYLISISEGDGRVLLNSLEIGVLSTSENKDGIRIIDLETIKNSILIKTAKYDKGGDEHYNTISAFIKSMRGTDPDATLYYLAKMINAGEDPKFIARRIIIAASEDVGNADPNALVIANACFEAVRNIGMPEGRIVLAQGALYVATAPKSNSSYLAIDKALEDIREKRVGEIPAHLKDTHYLGAKELGSGEGYKYPHDYKDSFIKQDYLPLEYRDKKYYNPTQNGYEKEIKMRLDKLFDNKE